MIDLFEPQKLSRGPVISLTVIALAFAMACVSLTGSAAALELNPDRATDQPWRLLTSAVAVEGWPQLALNVCCLLALMQLSEAVKGSLFHALDATAKLLLLNTLTLLLFAALRALCPAQGFPAFLLQLQRAYPNRGVAGLCALELFLHVTHFRAAPAFRVERRLTALLLTACFAALCLAHLFRLELPALLAVGVGCRLPALGQLGLLHKLRWLQRLETRLLFARRLLFLRSAQKEGRGGYAVRGPDESAEQRSGRAADLTFEAPRPPRDRLLIDSYEV